MSGEKADDLLADDVAEDVGGAAEGETSLTGGGFYFLLRIFRWCILKSSVPLCQ
jgi:hypothetical protein